MLNVGSLLASVLNIFLFALLGRLIFDYVQMFSRTWRPKGIILYFVEAIYTITVPGWKLTAERPAGRRHRIATVLVEKIAEASQISDQL